MGNGQTSHQVADVESRVGTEDSTVLFDGRDRIKGLTRLITAESKKKKQVKRDQYDYNKVNPLCIFRRHYYLSSGIFLSSSLFSFLCIFRRKQVQKTFFSLSILNPVFGTC